MRHATTLITLALMAVAGCGGDGNGNGDCADAAGSYTITEHCSGDVVGSDVTITQDGCSITLDWGGAEPWGGTVDGNTLTTSGDRGDGVILTCSGTLVADTWTSDCTPEACHVVVKKK